MAHDIAGAEADCREAFDPFELRNGVGEARHAFAGLANSDDGEVLLGDIVLAHGVCAREAEEKAIAIDAHAAHLIVHGTLHLLGYDHEQGEAEAEAMETLERAALAALGIADPYSDSVNPQEV